MRCMVQCHFVNNVRELVEAQLNTATSTECSAHCSEELQDNIQLNLPILVSRNSNEEQLKSDESQSLEGITDTVVPPNSAAEESTENMNVDSSVCQFSTEFLPIGNLRSSDYKINTLESFEIIDDSSQLINDLSDTEYSSEDELQTSDKNEESNPSISYEDAIPNNNNLYRLVHKWALKFHITFVALTALLLILRMVFNADLPLDAQH